MQKIRTLLQKLPTDCLQDLLAVTGVQAGKEVSGRLTLLISAEGRSLRVDDGDLTLRWVAVSANEVIFGQCSPSEFQDVWQEIQDSDKTLWATGTFPSPQFAKAYWVHEDAKASSLKSMLCEILRDRVRSTLGERASK